MKKIKQLTAQIALYAKATKKAWDDFIKMLEIASILITTGTAFFYGYTTDYSVDWFRFVVCGASVFFAGTMAKVWLEKYKEKVQSEVK